jgi:hypothetical protein
MNFAAIYVYVDGSDLQEIASFLLDQIRNWQRETGAPVKIVNDLLPRSSDRDFVLGYYDSTSGISEDIVFFGHESGHKSAAQIAWQFLGYDA